MSRSALFAALVTGAAILAPAAVWADTNISQPVLPRSNLS